MKKKIYWSATQAHVTCATVQCALCMHSPFDRICRNDENLWYSRFLLVLTQNAYKTHTRSAKRVHLTVTAFPTELIFRLPVSNMFMVWRCKQVLSHFLCRCFCLLRILLFWYCDAFQRVLCSFFSQPLNLDNYSLVLYLYPPQHFFSPHWFLIYMWSLDTYKKWDQHRAHIIRSFEKIRHFYFQCDNNKIELKFFEHFYWIHRSSTFWLSDLLVQTFSTKCSLDKWKYLENNL